MLSKLTMIGLNRYSDGALWENLVLPEGMSKELFINECLRQGGEFPVLYADLDFMKFQIGEWSKKWLHNFERWWKAYQFEYEALFNLDVKSTITEQGSNEESGSKSSNGRRTEQANESNNGSSNGGTTNTQSKAAYDSSAFQNVEQIVSTSNASSSGSRSNSVTNTLSDSENTSGSSSHIITTEEIRQGNQGVTMSQEMLLAEYNAWSFNIYNHMAEIFISEMCICIYV